MLVVALASKSASSPEVGEPGDTVNWAPFWGTVTTGATVTGFVAVLWQVVLRQPEGVMVSAAVWGRARAWTWVAEARELRALRSPKLQPKLAPAGTPVEELELKDTVSPAFGA